MSPRPADDRVRLALLEGAARVLATEGPEALTTRRLAREAGASTMAIYTHFERMENLRHAVRVEWLRRLSERLAGVSRTADPVADLGAVGWAYFSSAVENPHMFRATVVDPIDDGGVPGSDRGYRVPDIALEVFGVLAGAVRRCADEGRLAPGEAGTRALQIWMMGNGVLVAYLAGFITRDHAAGHFYEMTRSLLATFGDDPEAAKRSLDRGRRRMQRRMKKTAITPSAGYRPGD